MNGDTLGRREQNKERTRRALVQAAGRLFDEHGFEATTVRDIAAAAGVGERTFFRYFPSKESLVLQQARELIPILQQAVRDRPAAESGYTAMRNAVLGLLDIYGTAPAVLTSGSSMRLHPTSRGDRYLLFDIEEAVNTAILDRFTSAGADPAAPGVRLRASVQARAGVAALRAIRAVHPTSGGSGSAPADTAALVREAFAALEGLPPSSR
ncbi:TetR/AcrR family transcriptional regulator [Streptacidiphilus sp. P02-A3a]|uniref:TetR/AcrR family transcriptional regulator n=1 Tax=Streptacidiphilus sp. P02-A3a TaxID=2704468 RepID=UPI0015FDD3DE|nr:TetR/AcrR family transcriptional regulator [Streptacidiphilus sp. P02-A3a]QMU67049.1 TetR family transcriptional regulator [Streptacidiphilus sp. P02-A3a]